MKKILIKQATLVNEGKTFVADVLIAGSRIEKISSSISSAGNVHVINAEDLHLLPGAIDDQVHFREPGLTHKATIYSESRAAVAGGVTSFMEQPNTNPPATTINLLEQKYETARTTSLANFSFFMGSSEKNIEEIKKVDEKNICGVKIFMGSSTGDLAINNQDALENIFRHSPVLIATHCETDSMIKQNADALQKEFGDEIPVRFHPEIRSVENCVRSTKLAISLAQKHNARLHVFHISTAEEVDLFTNEIPLEKKRITAEACVHHLWFSANDYEQLGSLIKCNPAIKSARHKERILQGILENKIDVIATDHAPHTWEEKQNKNYFKCPSGLPLVQHPVNMMLEMVRENKISIEKVVEKMSHTVATLFNISERGFIREGYFADLILVNLNDSFTVQKNNLFYKCNWSPLEGFTFHNKIIHTFVNGNLAYSNGKFDESMNGMRLKFDR